MDTDYDNFASIYSCRKFDSAQTMGIITRTNNPSEEVIKMGLDAFARNGIDIEQIVPFPHDNCVYEKPDVPQCDA